MTTLNRSHRFLPVAIFFGSLLLFTFGLSNQEVIGFDSRFYLFAQEMWSNGISWFPTAYHQPYPDYPATSTIMINIASHFAGGVSKLTAVFPSAMMASLTVMLTYLIGAVRNPRWGLYAVCLMFLTVAFLKSARAIALDMYPTMVTACCFYLIYSADEYNQRQRVWWVYPLLLVSFAFRGPIGLVIPAGVVFAYYALGGMKKRNYRSLFLFAALAGSLLIFATIALLAIAHHVGGESFMQAVLRMEVLGRLDRSSLPRSFYFTNSFGNYALSYPFACFTMIGVIYYAIKKVRLENVDLLLKLIAWMLIILIGMSVPGDKKDRYILPMIPAIALLAAYPLVAIKQLDYFSFLRAVILRLFLYLPAILLLGTEVVYLMVKPQQFPVKIDFLSISATLIAAQVVSLWCCYRYINRQSVRELAILFFAALSFVATNMTIIEPIELYIDRAHEFIVTIEEQRLAQHAKLVFYKENPDSLPIKYLINMPTRETPFFIKQPEEILAMQSPAFFVTSEAYFMALPADILRKCRIIANDKLGHVRVVVFTQSQSSQNHL